MDLPGGVEWGESLVSSRELSMMIAYSEVPGIPERLMLFDKAFKLLEAVCTLAIVNSLESQNKSLEDQGKPAMVFGNSNSNGSAAARRGLEVLSPGELRDKDIGILQDILARARLPVVRIRWMSTRR